MKTCTKCGDNRGREDFYKDRRRADGLASWCKTCHNLKCRKWQAANRSRDLANKQRYIQQRRKDPEYVSHERGQFAEWQKANIDYFVASNRKRRSQRLGSGGSHTSEQLESRLAFYGWRCYLCGIDWWTLLKRNRTWDHVIPLDKGGTDWASNLRPACRSCNSRKRQKTLEEMTV